MLDLTAFVNQKLLEYVNYIVDPSLKEIIYYALFPGGKRLRPLLVLCILTDLEIDLNLGINQAAAIEMIHNYSLIHDDLPAMDNDDYRRGRLTVHKKYSEAMAILAGDALLTDAFLYFTYGKLRTKQKLKIIQLASSSSGSNGMVLGQTLDISSNFKNLSLAEVTQIHAHKTKDLIQLAIITGGIIANLSQEKLNELMRLADLYGLAFQIKDDLDDLKDTNSDIVNGKATYPAVIGKAQAIKIFEKYKAESLDICINIFGDKSLYKLIKRTL